MQLVCQSMGGFVPAGTNLNGCKPLDRMLASGCPGLDWKTCVSFTIEERLAGNFCLKRDAVMSELLQIETVVSMPPFEENCYVVWRTGSREALVFDPGLNPEWIIACLEQQGLTVAGILNTHGHADHIGGNAALKEAFPQAPLLIGANEAHMLVDAWANLSAAF